MQLRTPEIIINEIINKEKGYVNHPSDKGGPTNWGITEAVARRSGYAGPMEAMPRSVAVGIYHVQYIIQPRFMDVYNINAAIGMELIDTGVNMGVGVPSKLFQRLLNVFNGQGKYYPEINADGNIGPATLAAFNSFRAKRKEEGDVVFLRALNCLQGARYIEIAEKTETQEDFVYGWLLNRVEI
jgi:lysozyme family protein